MTAMQPTPPPAPATPVTPVWALYVYAERAFFTYDGYLIASASVATPAQNARIEGVYARLTGARITGDRRTRP